MSKVKLNKQLMVHYYNELTKSVKRNLEQNGCYYDDIYLNEYTQAKPSDIRDINIRILSVVSLISNHASWNLHYQGNISESEIYAEIYLSCYHKIYTTADSHDGRMYHRLSD